MVYRQCSGTKKNGQPCRAPATGDGFCVVHSEAYAERHKANQRKGGSARSNANRAARALPSDLRDVGQIILQALRDVRDGKLDPKLASAMAALANSYRAIHEAGDTNAKMTALYERMIEAEAADEAVRKTR